MTNKEMSSLDETGSTVDGGEKQKKEKKKKKNKVMRDAALYV